MMLIVSTGQPHPLPSGTVTFVMTDIEGSTRLLRRLGEEYRPVLWRHREVLRQAWAEFGGHEVDCQGDGCLVAFASAGDALAACSRAQRLLHAEPWPAGAAVRVRMGVHSGLATPRGSGYVAMAVHQAARVAEAAHGAQVLVSEQAAQALDDTAAALRPLGQYRVRDFDRPVTLHQLSIPELPDDFAAPRAMPAD